MQIVKLPISQLETNIGQIPDLPMNPRQWTKGQVETLAKSLRETPELFEARPVLVVPYGGKYVILGGNMRYEASKSNGDAEVPAIVFPADMPVAKMKEIVVKDNGAFGAWDWDALANEWDDLPLGDWGVPSWDVDAEVEKVAKDEERKARVPFSEVLGEEHNYIVLLFDNSVDWLQAQTIFGLEPVKSFPTVKGEDKSNAYQGVGVGRVINGAKAIGMIMEEKGNR